MLADEKSIALFLTFLKDIKVDSQEGLIDRKIELSQKINLKSKEQLGHILF